MSEVHRWPVTSSLSSPCLSALVAFGSRAHMALSRAGVAGRLVISAVLALSLLCLSCCRRPSNAFAADISSEAAASYAEVTSGFSSTKAQTDAVMRQLAWLYYSRVFASPGTSVLEPMTPRTDQVMVGIDVGNVAPEYEYQAVSEPLSSFIGDSAEASYNAWNAQFQLFGKDYYTSLGFDIWHFPHTYYELRVYDEYISSARWDCNNQSAAIFYGQWYDYLIGKTETGEGTGGESQVPIENFNDAFPFWYEVSALPSGDVRSSSVIITGVSTNSSGDFVVSSNGSGPSVSKTAYPTARVYVSRLLELSLQEAFSQGKAVVWFVGSSNAYFLVYDPSALTFSIVDTRITLINNTDETQSYYFGNLSGVPNNASYWYATSSTDLLGQIYRNNRAYTDILQERTVQPNATYTDGFSYPGYAGVYYRHEAPGLDVPDIPYTDINPDPDVPGSDPVPDVTAPDFDPVTNTVNDADDILEAINEFRREVQSYSQHLTRDLEDFAKWQDSFFTDWFVWFGGKFDALASTIRSWAKTIKTQLQLITNWLSSIYYKLAGGGGSVPDAATDLGGFWDFLGGIGSGIVNDLLGMGDALGGLLGSAERLWEVFPFSAIRSVPDLLAGWDVAPSAPQFEFTLPAPGGRTYNLGVDLGPYDDVAAVVRVGVLGAFVVGLAWATPDMAERMRGLLG